MLNPQFFQLTPELHATCLLLPEGLASVGHFTAR